MTLDAATQSLSLRCARFDTHIKCIEAEEFPPGPRPDEGDRLQVPLDELIKAVEQTQMAASTDEARPVLTGVLVQVQQGNLTLAATDGHRLAVRKLPASGGAELDASLIVPARALAELSRVLKGEPGQVEIIISKARNQIFFKAGNSELTSRLIDGKYPNYSQVIPSKSSTKRQRQRHPRQSPRRRPRFVGDDERGGGQQGRDACRRRGIGDPDCVQCPLRPRRPGGDRRGSGRAALRRSAQPRADPPAGQGALPLRDHACAGGYVLGELRAWSSSAYN